MLYCILRTKSPVRTWEAEAGAQAQWCVRYPGGWGLQHWRSCHLYGSTFSVGSRASSFGLQVAERGPQPQALRYLGWLRCWCLLHRCCWYGELLWLRDTARWCHLLRQLLRLAVSAQIAGTALPVPSDIVFKIKWNRTAILWSNKYCYS